VKLTAPLSTITGGETKHKASHQTEGNIFTKNISTGKLVGHPTFTNDYFLRTQGNITYFCGMRIGIKRVKD